MALCPTSSLGESLSPAARLDSLDICFDKCFDATVTCTATPQRHRREETGNRRGSNKVPEPTYFSPFSSGLSFRRNVKAQPAAVSLS